MASKSTKSKSIITFCAHNDDQVIGAGGTIKKYTDSKIKAYTYIFSYGEMSHPHLKPEVVAKMREKESIAAAKVLGDEISYLGFKEGNFAESCNLKQIKQIIKEKNPDKIFTHSPDDPHPDHQAVFSIVKKAIQQLNFRVELYSFDVWNIFSFKKDRPKLFVDISDTFKYKVKALQKHESQFVTIITLGWSIYFKAIVHGWNNKCRYAELFHKIDLEDD